MNTIVTTGNIQHHAINVADKLGLPYGTLEASLNSSQKIIYLIGNYFLANHKLISFAQDCLRRNKKLIIQWVGSDISDMFTHTWQELEPLLSLYRNPNILHIAEIDYTAEELKKYHLFPEVCPIPLKYYSSQEIKMPVDKLRVAIYMYGRPEFYYWNISQKIIQEHPNWDFEVYGLINETLGHYYRPAGNNVRYYFHVNVQQQIIPITNCVLRLTQHDGLPLGPIEFMIANRFSVGNQKIHGMKFTLPIYEKVVEALKEVEQSVYDYKNVSIEQKSIAHYWSYIMNTETISRKLNNFTESKFGLSL